MTKVLKAGMLPFVVLVCAIILFMPKDAKAVTAEQNGIYVDKAVVQFTPDASEEVLSYTIYVKKNDGDWVQKQTLGGGAQTATVTGLKPTDSYIWIKGEYKYKFKNSTTGKVYDGTRTVYDVKMRPAKVTGLHQERWYYYIKQINAEWTRQNSITGYQTEFYGHNLKKVKRQLMDGAFKNYNTYKKIKNGKTYKMRVRGYTEFGGTKVWGEWSAYTWFVGQTPKMKLTSKKKKITVTWGKVSGATSYTVMASTKPNKGYKAVKTVSAKKKARVTFKKLAKKKLKKGKTYYVYVRSNKKVGKKTFYSNDKGSPLYYTLIRCR